MNLGHGKEERDAESHADELFFLMIFSTGLKRVVSDIKSKAMSENTDNWMLLMVICYVQSVGKEYVSQQLIQHFLFTWNKKVISSWLLFNHWRLIFNPFIIFFL